MGTSTGLQSGCTGAGIEPGAPKYIPCLVRVAYVGIASGHEGFRAVVSLDGYDFSWCHPNGKERLLEHLRDCIGTAFTELWGVKAVVRFGFELVNPPVEDLAGLFENIARTHLDIETLDTRRSDRLDFHDCAVWSIRAALKAAYNAGVDATRAQLGDGNG